MTNTDTPDRAQSTSEQVVRAVADHRGVDPGSLEQSLYSVINPDALDALFAHTTGESGVRRLQFQYLEHEVTVEGDGTVTVTD
ncbi:MULTISPECIES: HalOD1 output domain-containing protein [Haloarcula]|uniref:HalOD1 output domain-containing protein n=1 Tax=Haloarcula TaxID=2237 RepID=UPI0023EB5F73|nr:HalOD1 output domain-containing protein [Halomicroarcula sp. XH51]